MSETLRQLIRTETRRQRAMLVPAAACAMLVGLSSVALLGLSGWFITAAALAGAAGPLAAQAFNYMLPSAAIRLLAITRTGARYGERITSHAAALSALAHLRPMLFRAVATMSAAKGLSLPLGDLSARLTQDIDVVEARFVRRSAPWNALAGALGGSVIVALAGWAAVGVMLGSTALLLVSARVLARQTADRGRQVQIAAARLKDLFGTMAGAAAELRCYGLEDWASDRLAERSRLLTDAQRAQGHALAWFECLQASATGVAAVAVLTLSAPAGMAVAALATLAAAMAMDSLAPLLRDLAARGAVEEAEARLDAVLDKSSAGSASTPEATSAESVALLFEGHRLVQGSRVALTGSSGAGKTSLIEAMIGLRAIAPGRVRVDGVELGHIPPDRLRSLFGWAPQDAALLAGTVRDNLLLARVDASDAELWAVLHEAAIDERIRALPGGLDGWIGDNGNALSGGERRRLSLARAYLAAAPWLLLDEPSEELDHQTELLIVERLGLRLQRTGQGLILVSHRAAPRALCDLTIAIEPGDSRTLRALAAWDGAIDRCVDSPRASLRALG
jgi:ATP-binding cassette subfamily C protein CydC